MGEAPKRAWSVCRRLIKGMEVDCFGDKCLNSKEQLPNKSATLNGGSLEHWLNMHRDQSNNNIANNDTIYDKLLENLSFHNVNIYVNETGNVADGPYTINFTDFVFVVVFCLLIIVVIIGNTLVILSVLTTRRLRTVTNLFVMSLAVADWLVGIFVMPPAVAYYLMGPYSFIILKVYWPKLRPLSDGVNIIFLLSIKRLVALGVDSLWYLDIPGCLAVYCKHFKLMCNKHR